MRASYYCLGFVFDPNCTSVVLIEKKRSIYKGRWNGIGGAVNDAEDPLSAMARECEEECGLKNLNWLHTATLQPQDESWAVFVYAANTPMAAEAKTCTDELVQTTPVKFLGNLDVAAHVSMLVHHSIARLHGHAPLIYICEVRK